MTLKSRLAGETWLPGRSLVAGSSLRTLHSCRAWCTILALFAGKARVAEISIFAGNTVHAGRAALAGSTWNPVGAVVSELTPPSGEPEIAAQAGQTGTTRYTGTAGSALISV